MFSSKIAQRVTVGFGAVVAGMAISTSIFAGTAAAEPIGPDGPAPKAGHCAIVHHDDAGNEWVEYVPTGSRDGYLGYCGKDGEWHAGLLIDERSNEPTGGGPTKPAIPGGGPAVVTDRR